MYVRALILLLFGIQNTCLLFVPKKDYNFRSSLQQLLANAHFRVVSYTVPTADRYLITVDRIVSFNDTLGSNYNTNRKPILLIPGISGTPSQFFMNVPEPDADGCSDNMG